MTRRRRRQLASRLGLALVSAVLFTGGCTGSSNDPTTTSAEAPGRQTANPDDYASRGARYPQWGFVTPSSEWMCVIGMYPSGGNHTACAVDRNQGPLPIAGVPFAQSRMGGISSELPNVITVNESGYPDFQLVSEPIWNGAGNPRVLPYDTVLQAGEFSCNVQESGVSCRNDKTGQGFSFSSKGYELVYTDVPAG